MKEAPFPLQAPQWHVVEFVFESFASLANPYVEMALEMEFSHDSGLRLRRPGFWDGGSVWRVRFTSPLAQGRWRWVVHCDKAASGLKGLTGELASTEAPERGFLAKGLLKMSPGKRNVLRAEGEPVMLVVDTAWALPWRATVDDAVLYAEDRADKGFNAALLMTVQPDMGVDGPEGRGIPEGFARGFDDLPQGTLKQIRPEYFQYFDGIVEVLLEHGIIPIYQPLFHGYGWKGKGCIGQKVSDEDTVRYSRYLVARFGAWPAIYLVGGDGLGTDASVAACGREVEACDCYAQPTGIHYAPHGLNDVDQAAEWLDFQWSQTGHTGEHRPESVAVMWTRQPAKGVANAEPTYEMMGAGGLRASGWWQGNEAWLNLCAGGTMGVFYGAGSLWSFNPEPHESGMEAWTVADGYSWKRALEFEGSRYVGLFAKVFSGTDFADMAPNHSYTHGLRGLAVPGKFFLVYLEEPPKDYRFMIINSAVPENYRVWDLRSGTVVATGRWSPEDCLIAVEGGRPLAVVFS